MLNYQNLLILLKNSYAWGFVLFWFLMLVGCITLWVLETRQGSPFRKLEISLYWLFGLVMLVFMAFRPFGIARDDLPYLEIYKTICPSVACGQWLQGVRDEGWFSTVGLLKSFYSDPRVMLWIGAVGLLIKLAVIFNLARKPLFVLLLYVGPYYQVQDLTAWRVSLALAFFMTAIWLLVRTRHYWNTWALLVCGFFHKQAFLAPMILMGVFLRQKQFLFSFLCLFPTVLVLLGLYPHLHTIASHVGENIQEIALSQGLDAYIGAKMSGEYVGWRQAPIIVYPQIMMTLWLLLKARPDSEQLDAMLIGCLVMACIFLWAFASLPTAQVRFFEFFMVPTVLLAGTRRLNGYELLGVMIVSGLFVAKYNLVHQLIGGP